jgi:hypothetical protein
MNQYIIESMQSQSEKITKITVDIEGFIVPSEFGLLVNPNSIYH